MGSYRPTGNSYLTGIVPLNHSRPPLVCGMRELRRELRGHKGPIHAVRWTNSGDFAVSCGSDNSILLWSPRKRREELLVKRYVAGPHGRGVLDVAIAPGNAKLASGGEESTCALWDITTGLVERRFPGHGGRINAVLFAPPEGMGVATRPGQILLTASYDRSIRAWDLRARGRTPVQTLDGFTDSVSALAATGSRIVGGSIDGTVRTFDLRACRVQRDGMSAPVTAVALSRDGKCLAVSTLDDRLRLMELSTGSVLAEYGACAPGAAPRGGCGAVYRNSSFKVSADLSAGDRCVVSGSEDGGIYVWELVASKLLQRLDHAGAPAPGGGAPPPAPSKVVSCVACHPTDDAVLSGGHDGRLLLWERRKGEPP